MITYVRILRKQFHGRIIQESHAVAEKLRDAEMYRNLRRHRAVLPAIAQHLVNKLELS